MLKLTYWKANKKIVKKYNKDSTVVLLTYKQIIYISPQISKFTKLVQLYLFENNLITIPYGISQLLNLECLWLTNNKLKYLPSDIYKLTKLIKLWIVANKLKFLPLIPKNIISLDIGGNQIIFVFINITDRYIPPDNALFYDYSKINLDNDYEVIYNDDV